MKRSLFLLTAIIVISFQTFAQQGKDALYLKNGSIVHGKLIEVKDGQYNIRTTDGLLFTFTTGEVEKFILGEQSETKEVKINDPNGFGFGIENGFLLGSSNNNFPFLFSLNPMLTYTFSKRHTLSAVSGIELFDQFTLPLLVEYRFNVLDANVSPFIYARAGGLIPLGGDESDDIYQGGWTCGVGTGFRWPVAGFESYIKFGFRYGSTVHKENSYYDYIEGEMHPADFTYQANFYRFEMKWGFKF
jgi:hypothetical protein